MGLEPRKRLGALALGGRCGSQALAAQHLVVSFLSLCDLGAWCSWWFGTVRAMTEQSNDSDPLCFCSMSVMFFSLYGITLLLSELLTKQCLFVPCSLSLSLTRIHTQPEIIEKPKEEGELPQIHPPVCKSFQTSHFKTTFYLCPHSEYSLLQMRKLRHGEVQSPVQGHLSTSGQSQDENDSSHGSVY